MDHGAWPVHCGQTSAKSSAGGALGKSAVIACRGTGLSCVFVTESSLQWPRGLACTLLPDLCKKHCRWCAGEMRVDSLPGNAVVAFTCSRSPESTFTHSPLAFQLAVSLCVVTPAAVLCDPTSDAAEHGRHRPSTLLRDPTSPCAEWSHQLPWLRAPRTSTCLCLSRRRAVSGRGH